MTLIAAQLKRFLNGHKVDYRLFCHSRMRTLEQSAATHDIPKSAFAQTILLQDDKGMIAAVLPLDCDIDEGLLSRILKRNLYRVQEQEADRLFYDCEPTAHPPIVTPYRLHAIVDTKLLKNSAVFFTAGSHTSVVKVETSDFHYLMADALWGRFAVPMMEQGIEMSAEGGSTKILDEILEDPFDWVMPDFSSAGPMDKMPKIVKQILNLAQSPKSSSEQLVSLLSQDPDISKMMKVCEENNQLSLSQKSVMDAPTSEILKHWLDFNTISHLVIGMGAKQNFKITETGLLGLDALWEHAVLSAEICEKIAHKANFTVRLDPAFCYLGALLQNFGFLWMGHAYPPEFGLLNRWFEQNPEISIKTLEKRLHGLGGAQKLLAYGHERLGFWLTHLWELPLEIQLMTKYHHSDYQGKHSQYVLLLRLVNRFLREQGIGEGEEFDVSSQVIESVFGISLMEMATFVQDILEQKGRYHPPLGDSKEVSFQK